MKGKKGTTDIYMLGLAILYIVGGAAIFFMLGSVYAQDNQHESIGFRQAAILEAYASVNDIHTYTQAAAKLAWQRALREHFTQGLFSGSIIEDEGGEGCGKIGSYDAWSNSEGVCISERGLEIDESLAEEVASALGFFYEHPLLKDPVRYQYSFSEGKLVGIAQEEVIIPIVGTKEAASARATSILAKENLVLGIQPTFDPDTALLGTRVYPDPDRRVRREQPTHVVLHYTVNGDLEDAKDIFLNKDLSIHYIVGRDGGIIQMVPENEVAYHAGGCDDTSCTHNDMNERSVGIEIVNFGWWNPDIKNNAPLRPNNGECPQGYEIAKRDCSLLPAEWNERCEKYDICWHTYTPAQIDTVNRLTTDIVSRWSIPEENIIAHSQVKREKYDPGPLLPIAQVQEYARSHKDVDLSQSWTTPGSSIEFSWFTTDKVLLACEEGIVARSKEGDPVYAIARGEIIDICLCESEDCDCQSGEITLKHSEMLYSRYTGFASLQDIEKEDIVEGGAILGMAANEGIKLQIYKDAESLTQDTDINPLCIYSEQTRAHIRAVDGCDKYIVNNTHLFTNANPVILENCQEVTIPTISASKCFEPPTQSQAELQVSGNTVGATQVNLQRVYEGKTLYEHVLDAAREHDVDPAFVLAVITRESTGDPYAVSSTGCSGIAQFCGATARGEEYGQYFRKESIKTCSCTRPPGAPYCSANIHSNTCDVENDDRFKPINSIYASAQFLSSELARYRKYDDRYYFAAAAYNTGAGNVNNALDNCAQGTWSCVKPQLRHEGQVYGDIVVSYMAQWGGTVPRISSEVECEDTLMKQLGHVRFLPHFSISIPHVNEETQKVIDWVESATQLRDNLQESFAQRVNQPPADWTMSLGFCSENEYENYIDEVLRGLQECDDNKQDGCVCTLQPKDMALPDGEYALEFSDGGAITLWEFKETDIRERKAVRTYTDLTAYNHLINEEMQQEDANGVRFRFNFTNGEREDGDVEYARGAVWIKTKNNPEGFYVLDLLDTGDADMIGLVDMPEDNVFAQTCLDTRTRFPVCAQADKLSEGMDVPLQLHFGVQLADTVMPQQPTLIQVSGNGNSLDVKFQSYLAKDLAGVLVYCKSASNSVPIRIPREELIRAGGQYELKLKTCGDTPITTAALYTIEIHSFDTGGNENKQTVLCQNQAHYSFESDLLANAGLGVVNGCTPEEE